METLSHYWSFMWGIHRLAVDSFLKGSVMRSSEDCYLVEQSVEQIVNLPVIWEAVVLRGRQCNVFAGNRDWRVLSP